ncbi:CAP domain-containing protein [Kitasatospora sp. NPDC101155]|uniref:CAP domain-containing protein n=1 Tax=Kitasatospora sp. NPDC101155 TaxID=3364097 RepID=UPI0037F4C60B
MHINIRTARRLSALLAVPVLVLTGGPLSVAVAGTATVAPTLAPTQGDTGTVLNLVNEARATAGCPALTVNSQLVQAAQAHSNDMAKTGNLSHTGSDGSSAGDRITKAGFKWSAYAENIAQGYGSAKATFDGWMNSSGHKANILNCTYKDTGIADTNGYWTQVFGTPQ